MASILKLEHVFPPDHLIALVQKWKELTWSCCSELKWGKSWRIEKMLSSPPFRGSICNMNGKPLGEETLRTEHAAAGSSLEKMEEARVRNLWMCGIAGLGRRLPFFILHARMVNANWQHMKTHKRTNHKTQQVFHHGDGGAITLRNFSKICDMRLFVRLGKGASLPRSFKKWYRWSFLSKDRTCYFIELQADANDFIPPRNKLVVFVPILMKTIWGDVWFQCIKWFN